MPELLDILQTRRSIRRYKSQAIPKDTIIDLLDQCRYAANSHNSQPFRYVVILDSTLKLKLIEVMGSIFEKDLRSDGIAVSSIQKIVKNSKKRFLDAPVLILACLTMEDMDQYSDSKRQACEVTMGIQSVANTLQNLLLIAHAKGLGACWYCAPLFCPDKVKSILNLPDAYIPQAFVTIGIPDESPSPITRKPIEDLIMFLE